VTQQPQPFAVSHHHLARISRNREGKAELEQWKSTVRASGIAELIDFVEGLADDAEAVVNGCDSVLEQRHGRGLCE
jgi:hypothetical protein